MKNYSYLKKYYTLIFLIFAFFGIKAQETDDIPIPHSLKNIFPPAPNAATLGEFGNNQVSLFTGTPQISIPIHTVDAKSISVPISLSYQGSPLKVEAVPSWVGAGWNLNAGGVITRVVRGLPDEKYTTIHTGFLYSGNEVANIDIHDFEFLNDISKGNCNDFQPDEFSFNFNGYSGRFFLNNQSNNNIDERIILFEYDKLKFEFEISNDESLLGEFISSITITTPDGTKYFFEEFEYSTNFVTTNGEHSLTEHCVNSWYLTRIETYNGDYVNFYYENETIRRYTSKVNLLRGYLGTKVLDFCPDNPPSPEQNEPFSSQNEQEIFQPRLSKIITNNTIVVFTPADEPRSDIKDLNVYSATSESYALKNILIYYRASDEAPSEDEIPNPNNLIKQFNFHYNYFGEGTRRLFLTHLEQVPIDETPENEIPGVYSFDYEDPSSVPSLNSNKQDHWGFFKDPGFEPSNLIPKFEYTFGNQIKYFNDLGSDRNTDTTSIKKGILTKITYPTGGYTKFFYEPNYIPYNESYEVFGEQVHLYKNTLHTLTGGNDVDYFVGCIDNYIGELSEKIINIVTNNNESKSGYTYTYKMYGNLPSNLPLDELSMVTSIQFGDDLDKKCVSVNGPFEKEKGLSYSNAEQIILKAGRGSTVELEIYEELQGDFNVNQSVSYVGGLKLKAQIDYADEDNYIKTKYSYEEPHLFTIPKYHNEFTKVEWLSCGYGFKKRYYDKLYLNLYANSQIALQSFGSSPVGYEKVTVTKYDKTGSNLGKEENIFYGHSKDAIPRLESAPFPPYEGLHPKTGKLSEKIIYSSTTGKVLKEEYNYVTGKAPVGEEFSQGFVLCTDVNHGDQFSNLLNNNYDFEAEPPFNIAFYDMNSYWVWLSKTTKTEYLEGGEYTTIVNKQLDVNNQLYKTESEIYNKNYKTIYKYPYSGNLEAILPANNEMIDSFILNKPVEQINYVNDIKSKHQVIDYEKENGKINPENVRTLDVLKNDFYNIASYLSYDEYNNPTEIKEENGTTTVILWGYYGSYPIAKIEGEDISFDLVMSNLSNNYHDIQQKTEDELQLIFNSLRNSDYLQNTMITTFTYKPLIGISTQTDPNGITTYYEYDSFGRLITIRDKDDKILKHFEYNYFDQNNE